MHFKTKVELSWMDDETDAEIEFEYTAGEREYKDSPAVPADVEITSARINGVEIDLTKLSKDDMIAFELVCWEKLGDLEESF